MRTKAGRPVRSRNRRYLAIAAVVVAAVVSLVAAKSGVIFSPGPPDIPQSLMESLPGDLAQDPHECRAVYPLSQWAAPGWMAVEHCTDAGLPGGNIYVYLLKTNTDFRMAWKNFNDWWKFRSNSVGTKCPPEGTSEGIEITSDISSLDLPTADESSLECGQQATSHDSFAPTYAWSLPGYNAILVAQGASGTSFTALRLWASRATPHSASRPTPPASLTLAAGVASLTQLLPGDLSDTTTECSAYKGPFDWSMPGLAQALTCTDPSLSGGYIYAYQMDSSTNYVTAWQNFNKYWAFDVSSTGTACPPTGSNGRGRGITPWHSSWFPYVNGQVLECAWVGANGTYNRPAYTYAYPTEDAFITVVAAPNSAFDALNTWWTTYAAPAASPSPAAP
jgi:hypothetical protein